MIRIAGARVSTVNVQLARESENAPPGRDTSTVCSPSASLSRGRKTILPPLGVTRDVTGPPSSAHVVAAASSASPATLNASVDRASRPTSADSGPVASSPPVPPRNATNAATPTNAAPPAIAYSVLRLRVVSRARADARRAEMSSQRSNTARAAARTSSAAPFSAAACASRRNEARAAGRRLHRTRRRAVARPPRSAARSRGRSFSRSPLAPFSEQPVGPSPEARRPAPPSAARPSVITVTRYAFGPLRYPPR